jgi:hypothetical protein
MKDGSDLWSRFKFWFDSVFGSLFFGLLLVSAFIIVVLDATGIW